MGKLIVIVIFALSVSGIVWHLAPHLTHQAFNVGGMGVSYLMLVFLGSIVLGHRLVGKH
jgi:hypothetical protein